MTFVIGLTGGIGSGKTTVANLFAKNGVKLIDADVIARQVVEPGTDALRAIYDKFGPNILNKNKSLNRATLREHIFKHPSDKQWLNALLHPIIKQQMIVEINAITAPYCLAVIPLLIENKLESLCQRILVVDVSEQTQIYRTIARDNANEKQVASIIAAQASRQARLAVADDIVTNNDSEKELTEQVKTLHNKYLALANKYRARNEQSHSLRTPFK